jgi:hypothetical protein
MKLIKYAVLIGAVCAAFAMQPAKADFISTLNVGNDAISGFPGPYGTVTVSLSGQVATITFSANTAGGFWFIDGGAAAVQVNASSFTPNIVTDADFKQFDSGNVDGFGSFNLVIDNNNASTLVDTIVFTVENTSVTLWASASDVLAFNSGGGNPGGPFDAAAHISVPGGGVTGFAGEGPGGVVTPDGGATAALLGLGLAGLAGLRARFGRN